MSQRTRARMTGDAKRKAPEPATPTPNPSPTERGVPESATMPDRSATARRELAPEALARTLRAVAAELERDPALASRIAAALAVPTLDTGRSGELPTGTSDQGTDAPIPAPPPLRRERGARASPRSPMLEDGSPLPLGEGLGVGASGVNRSFRPRVITGAGPELGAGIPDPFILFARTGEQGLRAALAKLRTGGLRAIVREHKLDPAGRLAGNNDADKLRAAIMKAVVRAAQ